MVVSPNAAATASTDDTARESARSCLCPLVTLPMFVVGLVQHALRLVRGWALAFMVEVGAGGRALLGSRMGGAACALACAWTAMLNISVACGLQRGGVVGGNGRVTKHDCHCLHGRRSM